MATPKTVLLQVNDVNANYRPTHEALAGEILTPGNVVGLASTGKLTHLANTVPWPRLLVVESEYVAETALGASAVAAIDDTYAADELTFYVNVMPGDLGYCILTDGEDIAIGDLLVMGNDTGKLVERTTEDLSLVVGHAEEVSAPSGADGRVKVRFW